MSMLPFADYLDEHFCTLERSRRIVITWIASKKEQMFFVPADIGCFDKYQMSEK